MKKRYNSSLYVRRRNTARNVKPPRKKWRVMHVLGTAFKRMLMMVGFLVLLSAIISTIISAHFLSGGEAPSLPERTVLFMPLEDVILEHPDMTGPYSFANSEMTLYDMISSIDRAVNDERVLGLAFALRGGVLSLSQIEELRDAVLRFRKSGKFTYIYAPSYQSLGEYYLASAFEEIWMQPMGMMSIPGLNMEVPFARDALDKIGIEPQFFQRKDYKSIFESANESEMSAASREASVAMINTISQTIMNAVGESRVMEASQIKQAIDKGILVDSEALALGMVDRLGYGDEINEEITERVTGDPESDEEIFTFLGTYNSMTAHERSMRPKARKKEIIPVLHISGTIVQYEDGSEFSLSAAENVVSELRAIEDNEDIKAVIIRVDSPGGAPTAAEAIRRAIVKLRESGKTVIVSMGTAAASGGYWISAPADYIFALPSTFTGSIGVAGGKVSLREMWGNLNINWDSVEWGENAGFWSLNEPFDTRGRERINALMDNTYERFVTIVGEGRDMNAAQVENVSQGRVWMGAQAVQNGLVDELGGLDAALDYAAKVVGQESRMDVTAMILPRPLTPIERIMDFLELQAGMGKAVQAQMKILQSFGMASEMLAKLGIHTDEGLKNAPVNVFADVPQVVQ